MTALENLTEFAAACLPSMSRDDHLLTLVVVSARFHLPPPRSAAAPRLAEEQGEVRLADEYDGHAAAPLLLYEGQSTYTRPGTDLYMHGHAWAPGGRPTAQDVVELRVGGCHRRVLVFGDRVWTRTAAGVSPSRPTPFASLPLTYRRCFGGTPANPARAIGEAAEYNPVGCGLYNGDRDALDQPLPNFEDPEALLLRTADRPRPGGFGPIARHWRPRRTYAGTYDQTWAEQRVPLWPRDLDERFFSAAAPGLLAVPYLKGGEPVQIVGMSPDGAFEFSLPRVHLQARFEAVNGAIRRRLTLDAIHFEPDAALFTMYWRACAMADPLTIRAVSVRALDPWELA